jgi:hypothetical protein
MVYIYINIKKKKATSCKKTIPSIAYIGRNIPTLSETFEFEDSKRNACYDMEEEEYVLN